MATHSSVLSWRIPGMGEPGGLPSMGSHRVGHDWHDLAGAAVTAACIKYETKLSYLLVYLQGFLYLVHMWIKALWTSMLVERVGSKKYISQILADDMIHFIILSLNLNCIFFLPIEDNCCCYWHY